MNERFLCIHGHFYQPPREDPKTGEVPAQEGAAPYHDWNEKISAECYRPMAAADLYEKISFDFGPTLLNWMEAKSPEVYRAVIEADRKSQRRFSGHGSALAHPYHHVILPLANERDKRTEILWGLSDFEARFGRKPEGMWLPETAVDVESLEILAKHRVKFTILAPHQIRSVHKIRDHYWYDNSWSVLDPSMPYVAELPSGRSVTVFLYDEPVSRAVAFEGLLHNGDHFLSRLFGAFSEERTWPELVHVATDGETYGHHHKFGDMALAYVLDRLESSPDARLINHGQFLSRFRPTHQVEILEKTSWSCPHGVERWRSDCGCRTGSAPGSNQRWRAPLRAALDWLRDEIAPLFEEEAAWYLKDPWEARDRYIDLMRDASSEARRAYFEREALRRLTAGEEDEVVQLLELQRHLMGMYTSCGWFFDDPTDLGTVQILKYAARALDLAGVIFENDWKKEFSRLIPFPVPGSSGGSAPG